MFNEFEVDKLRGSDIKCFTRFENLLWFRLKDITMAMDWVESLNYWQILSQLDWEITAVTKLLISAVNFAILISKQ